MDEDRRGTDTYYFYFIPNQKLLFVEKKYQVFISSTFQDLQEERLEVIQALLELDCIPVGMEMFPAADDDQWTLITRLIDDCDYYVLIVAGRYGSLGADGRSYTQMEYEYAISKGVPVISFLVKDPGGIIASKSESDPKMRDKLDLFKELAQKKMCKFWNSPSDLGSQVSRSLIKLIKNNPRAGWVKATQMTSESSLKEILRLQRVIEDLQEQIRSAPEGVENLAQGDDVVVINYDYVSSRSNSFRRICDVGETSWNDIFSFISPSLISGLIDEGLRNKINMFLKYAFPGSLVTNKRTEHRVEENDFQTIKVQLRALGLIVEKQASSSKSSRVWTLTPYGDKVMTHLRAVRKKKNSL